MPPSLGRRVHLTSETQAMPLTKIECDRAKCPPGKKFLRLTDALGLYLEVTPSGGKYWRLKFRFAGREKRLSLGVFPAVSLAEAREGRDQARKLLSAGMDPSEQRRQEKATRAVNNANTFEAVARAWHAFWSVNKSERHAGYVMARLEADVFPEIGRMPLDALTAPHFIRTARKIEERGAMDLAKRAFQTCGQVMRYAVAHGLHDRNPCADIRPSDALKPRDKGHYARIDARELPDLLRKIDTYKSPITRLAMQFMALTFVRTGELIAARWDEIDWTAQEWRIPAERMKMKTPHIVPLSPQALAVLMELRTLTGKREHLFPGGHDPRQPMSNGALLGALKRMGYAGRMTGHGFRGVASTILHEQGYPHHCIELQLAHQERNQVSAAYNFATYLKDRRIMMEGWANYLAAARDMQQQATAKPLALARA